MSVHRCRRRAEGCHKACGVGCDAAAASLYYGQLIRRRDVRACVTRESGASRVDLRCERCLVGYQPLKGPFGCVQGNAGEAGDKCECVAGEPLCRAKRDPENRRLSAHAGADGDGDGDATSDAHASSVGASATTGHGNDHIALSASSSAVRLAASAAVMVAAVVVVAAIAAAVRGSHWRRRDHDSRGVSTVNDAAADNYLQPLSVVVVGAGGRRGQSLPLSTSTDDASALVSRRGPRNKNRSRRHGDRRHRTSTIADAQAGHRTASLPLAVPGKDRTTALSGAAATATVTQL